MLVWPYYYKHRCWISMQSEWSCKSWYDFHSRIRKPVIRIEHFLENFCTADVSARKSANWRFFTSLNDILYHYYFLLLLCSVTFLLLPSPICFSYKRDPLSNALLFQFYRSLESFLAMLILVRVCPVFVGILFSSDLFFKGKPIWKWLGLNCKIFSALFRVVPAICWYILQPTRQPAG